MAARPVGNRRLAAFCECGHPRWMHTDLMACAFHEHVPYEDCSIFRCKCAVFYEGSKEVK